MSQQLSRKKPGGIAGGSGLPYDDKKIKNEYGKEDSLDYNFVDKIKDLYIKGVPEILDMEIITFLKNKMWGVEEYGAQLQPWRENGFLFYENETVAVIHGSQFGIPIEFTNKLFEKNKTYYLFGHSHGVRPDANFYRKKSGSFVHELLGIIAVCDAGIPSSDDFIIAAGIAEQVDSKLPQIVIGEQFVTFYKGNIEAVFDVDDGSKIGSDVGYTPEAWDIFNSETRYSDELYVEGFSTIYLENDGEFIYYDMFGNKTGGVGGAQKELRKVSGGIKVSSQGYVSLEY